MQADTPPDNVLAWNQAPTPPKPPTKYVKYNTKRLGMIKVPNVPLPYFVVGESTRKRPPVDVAEAFEEVKV